ncbi:MAG: molybdate ABC transporter substrate-binding protein [Gemmatimonadota bacterium]|jgi:molybdate transport system substrate-binding protein
MPSRRQAGAAALVAIVAACGGPGAADDGTDGRDEAGVGPAGEVLVSAAASLTDAFVEVESAFEAAHPDVDVVLNLGGSSSLRAQILEGAPVDVFASAGRDDMDRVVAAGRASGEPDVFAHNLLRIAVPAGNPARVDGLDDFADEALHLGLCAEDVPCGDFARLALRRARVVPALDTNEPNVRALLTKVELGELDAGITYATDVASARGSVEGIDIPGDVNVVAEYPIAVLAEAPNPGAAGTFVRFVLSGAGRAILAKHGFGLP